MAERLAVAVEILEDFSFEAKDEDRAVLRELSARLQEIAAGYETGNLSPTMRKRAYRAILMIAQSLECEQNYLDASKRLRSAA